MNPRPVRATAESVSAQRSRSTAEGLNGSVTAVRLTVRSEALVERHGRGEAAQQRRPECLDRVAAGEARAR